MTLTTTAGADESAFPGQPLSQPKSVQPEKPGKSAKPAKPVRSAHSLKERQREEREQLILRTAQELLLERGYHDMSIDEIAERVGISKGTVYLHFDGKEALLLALLNRGMREFTRAIDDTLSSPGAPREKLRAVLELFYSGMSSAHAQVARAAFQNPAMLGRLAEHRQQLGKVWDGPRKRIAALIEEGKAAGEFDPDMPTPLLLSLFRSLLSPHDYQRLVVEEGLSREEVLRAVTKFYFRGITPECVSDRCSDQRAESPEEAPSALKGVDPA